MALPNTRPSSGEKGKKGKKKPSRIEIPGTGNSPTEMRPPNDLDSHTVMEINGKHIDVHVHDLQLVEQLGKGINGPVNKMMHTPSGMMMAVKRIQYVSNDSTNEKRIQMDLETNMKCKKLPHTVRFYGALYYEGDVWICMEVMDTCLDKFYHKVYALNRTIPEDIIGQIALCVIIALQRMKQELQIAHRDVKPSNILLNREGEVKICDYGISGRLENSLMLSYVGTQMYMAPEYIDPSKDKHKGFSVRADVWSLGLTLMEIATGVFPYEKFDSVFKQIKVVIEGDPPRLPADKFSPEFCDFIATCLTKEEDKRPKFNGLLKHPFIIKARENNDVQLGAFVTEILDASS